MTGVSRANSKDVGLGKCPSAEFLESPDMAPTVAIGGTLQLSFKLQNIDKVPLFYICFGVLRMH